MAQGKPLGGPQERLRAPFEKFWFRVSLFHYPKTPTLSEGLVAMLRNILYLGLGKSHFIFRVRIS